MKWFSRVSVLEQFPKEKEAFHCKIVCLLQLGKFKEANAELDDAKVTPE